MTIKMIDTRELSQGHHILYGGDMVAVEDICRLKDKPTIVVNWGGQRTATMPQNIDPIPLTEELLAEIGFEKEESADVFYKLVDGGFEIRIGSNVTIWQYKPDLQEIAKVSVRYLHELEQFVFLTTKSQLI